MGSSTGFRIFNEHKLLEDDLFTVDWKDQNGKFYYHKYQGDISSLNAQTTMKDMLESNDQVDPSSQPHRLGSYDSNNPKWIKLDDEFYTRYFTKVKT